MPLISFRLRRTDDVGSYVREEERDDSAIRADNYIAPSDAFGTSTFSVNVFNFASTEVEDATRPGGSYTEYTSQIDLAWTLEQALEESPDETAPVAIYIVHNQFGEPVTVENGEITFTCNSDNYVEEFRDISTNYRPGTWVYYGFFIKYSDGATEWFERAAVAYVQIPYVHNSIDNFWNRIPLYYKVLDYQEGNSNLYNFLKLFAWELDKTRSLIDSVVTINDPSIAPPAALDLIAAQLGVPLKSADLGTAKLRNVLNNIFELRKRKGSPLGATAFISALSGCKSVWDGDTNTFKVYSQRVNLVSDPKFRQQDLSFYLGTPAVIDRVPFTLRVTSGGSALRDPDNNDDALRAYTSNPTALEDLAAYTTNITADAAASVGWGVYTYGAAFTSAASVPIIETIIYNGENISNASVEVVESNGDGIRIEIPSDATGAQTVVVYGRKPFMHRNEITYYTSFNCNLSGASFINSRFIAYDDLINFIEIDPPDSLGEFLYYDTWNTEGASAGGLFLYGNNTSYNASSPALATAGRFAVQYPAHPTLEATEEAVVPALVFAADPGDVIIVSKWLVEPESFSRYFDGDEIFGGFIQEANQSNPVGMSDYRWGESGGNNNEDFSYYTLDYGRVVPIVERIVEQNLVPVNMIGQYTMEWNIIPGE